MPDPWAEFHLEDIETEQATRYRSVSLLLLMLVLNRMCWFMQGLCLCTVEYV